MNFQAISLCRRALLVCLLSAMAVNFWTSADAQQAKPTRPFSHIVADWNAAFAQTERYLAGTSYAKSATAAHRRALT